jgi:hypothetical protein
MVIMTNSDLTTAHWAVALEGDAFDIEDAHDLFAQHEEVQVRIIEVAADRKATVLVAKEFESLSNHSEVFEASQRIFDFLNGIMFVLDPRRKALRPGAVHQMGQDGRWSEGTMHAKLIAMTGRFRAKFAGVVLQATRLVRAVQRIRTHAG